VNVTCRICFLALSALLTASNASAQTYVAGDKPRKHFVTVSYDSLYTQPLHFAEHPLEDLLGRPVAGGRIQEFEYHSRDESTLIDVVEYTRRQRGFTASIYPFGMSTGPALMLRGAVEPLPRIDIVFSGPSPIARYTLNDARALDASIGLLVADRSPGWGLGSHAFVLGGVGRITSGLGGGSRYFAEAGGGLGVGPFGVELGVKFAVNKLAEPVPHQFLTIPITVRGTLTF
jgi:hypothetical protein